MKKKTLCIDKISADIFFEFLKKEGQSSEVGQIKTQYRDELSVSEEFTGVFGCFACEELIAVISYGLYEIKHNPEFFSVILDTVIVKNTCRGFNLSQLMINYMFSELEKENNYKVISFSTIAVHPAVVSYMKKLGMQEPTEHAKCPRYYLNLEESDVKAFSQRLSKEFNSQYLHLKHHCFICEKHSLKAKWCPTHEG